MTIEEEEELWAQQSIPETPDPWKIISGKTVVPFNVGLRILSDYIEFLAAECKRLEAENDALRRPLPPEPPQ